MDWLIVLLVVVFGSALTFFSGFGLGTILLPVFLLFFEPKMAIPAVAVVHFTNSVFKFVVVRKYINKAIFLRFGLPAIAAALLGAYLLTMVEKLQSLFSYNLFDKNFEVSWIAFLVGLLILSFTWIESSKRIARIQFQEKHMALGGVLSGLFGGLSGHQGALRSLFLKNAGLSKEQFVGTSNAISLVIDISRISLYLWFFSSLNWASNQNSYLILIGMVGAFIGVSLGNKLLKKITSDTLQRIVSLCLVLFALLLMFGII